MKRKQTNLYPQLVIGLGASAYFFVLLSDPVLATDMWTKAEDIMKGMSILKSLVYPPLPPLLQPQPHFL